MSKSLPSNAGPHLIRVAEGAKWMRDCDGMLPEPWAQEINDVLRFLDQQGQLDRLLPRLRGNKRIFTAAIGEGRAGLFLENLGFKIIEWEPSSIENKQGDLLICLNGSKAIFVEVKSPDWESELSSEEQRGQRKSYGKYVHAEVRITNPLEIPLRIIHTNVLPKLSDDRSNLVVFVDDLFSSPADAHEVIDGAIDEFFATNEAKRIGGILFLIAETIWGRPVRYISNFYPNPHALEGCRLPQSVLDLLARRSLRDKSETSS